jgi:Transcriptional regulators
MSMDLKDLLEGTSTGYTRDLDDMVVEVLRKAILSGHFKSGERIAPAEIAEILQVSRMPVREAVQKLEAYGIVTVTGGRGSVVRGLSAKEFGQLCMVRELLEPTAAGLAAENIKEAALRELEKSAPSRNRPTGKTSPQRFPSSTTTSTTPFQRIAATPFSAKSSTSSSS